MQSITADTHEPFLSPPNPNGHPPSKLIENVRRQGRGRPVSFSSSGSSDEGSGSDTGSGELRLSRYVTQAQNKSEQDSDARGLVERMDGLRHSDATDNGVAGDGAVPTTGNFGPSSGYSMAGNVKSGSDTGSQPASTYGTAGHTKSASPDYGPSQPAHGNHGRSQTQHARSREGSSSSALNGATSSANNGGGGGRPLRPTMGRTPSHAYAPARRPSQYITTQSSRDTRHNRSSSEHRRRLNPDAEYRAQKKAYVQRLKQDNAEEEKMMSEEGAYPPPSLGYSSGSESGENSPTTASFVDNDPYDQETQLMFGNEDMSPSAEELKIPANRERLEWHSMLANVLTGDVVKQEKKRMTGATDQQDSAGLRYDLWVGIRARCCGRPVATHKRMLDEQRTKAPTMIEDIIAFAIKGEAEAGKSARGQVEDIVKKIEKLEGLYPNISALEQAHSRAASDDYKVTCAAVVSWNSTTALINTELGILQAWVGNEELDFQKPRERSSSDSHLTDESSFIDRILKEDGMRSLQGRHSPAETYNKRGRSLLGGVGTVIQKAKMTLIENADVFASKHLPPYMEELLTLINFPSRLVQEIIRVRLTYADKIAEQAQGMMIAEQMLSQFQILLNLAVDVKEHYLVISEPEPGWDLPPCIDEKFDETILNAFQFYFKMLSWKLTAGNNTFKEAEILEQEWGFLSNLGRHFDGGDVEVAEQFRYVPRQMDWTSWS